MAVRRVVIVNISTSLARSLIDSDILVLSSFCTTSEVPFKRFVVHSRGICRPFSHKIVIFHVSFS